MTAASDFDTQLDLAPTIAALPGDVRRTIDRLASLGFRAVQLSATQPGLRPRELDGSARRDLLSTLRRRELAVSGLDLWIPSSHFSDPAHMDRAVGAAVAGLDLAADLGRCPVSVTLPMTETHSREEHVDDAAVTGEAVQAVLDAANRAGVPLADHHVPVAGREWDEIIGVGIDPAAWLAAGDDPVQAVHQHSDHLIAARVSDLLTTGLRGPIGTSDGRLDVMSYHVALTVAGYRRPAILDARQWPDPWTDMQTAAAHWRRATP